MKIYTLEAWARRRRRIFWKWALLIVVLLTAAGLITWQAVKLNNRIEEIRSRA